MADFRAPLIFARLIHRVGLNTITLDVEVEDPRNEAVCRPAAHAWLLVVACENPKLPKR